jgi:hypothetical protein
MSCELDKSSGLRSSRYALRNCEWHSPLLAERVMELIGRQGLSIK